MSRKVLFVCKGGCVFRAKDAQSGASPVGEGGETEGLMRHLVAAFPDVRVVYHGQYRGTLPDGIEGFAPEIGDLTENSSGSEQRECSRIDYLRMLDLLGDDEPVGLLNVAGYAPTFSHIDNPNHAAVQAAAVRYTAPMIELLSRFSLPRLVINNDPRTYPRDQEMSFGSYRPGWEHVRPCAMLDQWTRTRDVKGVVGGREYVKRSVYGHCESWSHLDAYHSEQREPCVVLAHAHVVDGMRSGDVAAWEACLGDVEGIDVYGRGWEEIADQLPNTDVTIRGPCKASEVGQLLAGYMCCPVMTHTPGFMTGKPYVLMASGCVPLLFGPYEGHLDRTYDQEGMLVPTDSRWRITHHGALRRLVHEIQSESYENQVAIWQDRVRPRFGLLDQMVGELLDGRDPRSARWHEDYGGYWPVAG